MGMIVVGFELLSELFLFLLRFKLQSKTVDFNSFFSPVFLQAIFKELHSCFYYDTFRLAGTPNYTISNLSFYVRNKISY